MLISETFNQTRFWQLELLRHGLWTLSHDHHLYSGSKNIQSDNFEPLTENVGCKNV